MLPPLLTVVILLWVAGTIKQYALEPVTVGTRNLLAWYLEEQDAKRLAADPETLRKVEAGEPDVALPSGEHYVRLSSDAYVPLEVKKDLADDPDGVIATGNRRDVYRRYVELVYMRPRTVIPLFICLFILILYLLGKLLGAGIGRVLWNLVERAIFHRLPLVRNVYDSVKQMTDFMFNERELGYKRVVAVEYPRKGVWALGFVTGESLAEIRAATGEPMISMMIPSSPMSVTGYMVTVPKSETIDLDLTIDQALQFMISCGVVVPPHQLPKPDSMEAARS